MFARDFAKRCLFVVLRAGFRFIPMPTATRDRLRQRFLERHAGLMPSGPRGQASANRSARRPLLHAGGRAIGYREPHSAPLPDPLPATLVAFYLPQFHPIPENDHWWGDGFTEWRNVTRALPQFEGHAQPRLPGALGFYDLRLPDAMRQQMALAREHGIGAFCSYFYWFGGKTLLEQPLQQWLVDTSLDLPLCLCWANENWSRRWDGRGDQVLIAQQHSPEDDLAFISHIAPYLRDTRYLRTGGKPLLLVYRPGLLPDPAATAATWRRWCATNGLGEIHLAYVQSFDNIDPRSIGFDSAVAFPPNNTSLQPITARQRLINPEFRGDVLDWRELASEALTRADPDYPLHPCVNPGWDNEPRRSGAGRVFVHASPRGYCGWLRHAIAAARRREPGNTSPLVFINAWNEWAEGAVLEPDMRLGHAWLHATRAALSTPTLASTRPCAVIHAWYPEVLGELLDALRASTLDWRLVVTTAPECAAAVRSVLDSSGLAHELVVIENRGRDILPFLHVADHLLDEGVDAVLKLHTKRSTHRADGKDWRQELVTRLLAPERAPRLAAAFDTDPSLGMIAAEGHIQPLGHYLGANRETLDYLAVRIGMDAPCDSDEFVAGSMLWVRLAALRPLLDAQLEIQAFESEHGQIDGTLAHAVERLFASTARHAGFHVADAATLCGEPQVRRDYPYAKRDLPRV
ncbi:glycoside hydrolase family 99-like domain-containing protein [Rhodanobacter geophilus]|uniref:Glycoside hydrolase family 99-like domain-containing protein n=1 Tax=Rhodanobacter geophilus TaxID=3162488 RepID=A0ABV3QQZ6_9GAMM